MSAELPSDRPAPNPWERGLLDKLLNDLIVERRRARRWGIFFKGLFALYVLLAFGAYFAGQGDGAVNLLHRKHVAVVEASGIITAEGDASAERINEGLKDAFEHKDTVAVILHIDSPGGSPVEAGLVFDEARRLRKKHPTIPLYAVIQGMGASGGYYIAAGADKIYADKASVVGSIGVRMENFGFVEALQKLGVERRLLTSGEHKGLLDPFLPIDLKAKERVQGVLDNIHRQFINAVKDGRGKRLKEDPLLFSGLIWTGEQALPLGLVDGLGDLHYVAREVAKEERLVDFTPRPDLLRRFGAHMGASIGRVLLEQGFTLK